MVKIITRKSGARKPTHRHRKAATQKRRVLKGGSHPSTAGAYHLAAGGQKKESGWNRTKKFFRGLKQKLSQKFDPVAKFIRQNPDNTIICSGSKHQYYFTLDKNTSLHEKLKSKQIFQNIAQNTVTVGCTKLYDSLKDKGLLGFVRKTDGGFELFINSDDEARNIPVSPDSDIGNVRIFVYQIDDRPKIPAGYIGPMATQPQNTGYVEVSPHNPNPFGLGPETAPPNK